MRECRVLIAVVALVILCSVNMVSFYVGYNLNTNQPHHGVTSEPRLHVRAAATAQIPDSNLETRIKSLESSVVFLKEAVQNSTAALGEVKQQQRLADVQMSLLEDRVSEQAELSVPAALPTPSPTTRAPTVAATLAPLCLTPESCTVVPQSGCLSRDPLPRDLFDVVCGSLNTLESSSKSWQAQSPQTSVSFQNSVFSLVTQEFERPECIDTGKGLEHLDCWRDVFSRASDQIKLLGKAEGFEAGTEGVVMLLGPVESQRIGVLVTAFHLRHHLKYTGPIELWSVEGEGHPPDSAFVAVADLLKLSRHMIRSFAGFRAANSAGLSALARNLLPSERKDTGSPYATCVKWIQTGDCNPQGEMEGESSCDKVIQKGVSGYCQCDVVPGGLGEVAAEVGCNHDPFTCDEMCALPISSSERASGKVSTPAYAYKPLVLLMSSLDSIIFLDADNIMFSPPESLFEAMQAWHGKNGSSALFWPDLWTLDNQKRAPLWEAVGGAIPHGSHQESGQLVICKSCGGFVPLSLALFFNIYFSPYYSALYSGTYGEGDKDTFQLAWHALKQPYRLLPRAALAGAMRTSDASFFGISLAQAGPSHGKLASSDTQVLQQEDDFFGFIHHNGVKWGLCELLNPVPWIVLQSHTGKYDSDSVEITGDLAVKYQCSRVNLKHPVRYLDATRTREFPKEIRDFAHQAMLHVFVALGGHTKERCPSLFTVKRSLGELPRCTLKGPNSSSV